jgi:hypothetical protein
MSHKRTKTIAVGAAAILIGLFLILLAAASFILPRYLESRVIPKIAADAGISDYELDVRRVGLNGADLGPLRIGRDKTPALLVRSIQIDYRLKGLLRYRIERAVLSGIEIHADYSNGHFSFRGFDLQAFLSGKPSKSNSSVPARKIPATASFGRIEIRNATAIFEINNRLYHIPFESDITAEDRSAAVFDVDVHFYPRGQKISAAIRADLDAQSAVLQLDAYQLDLVRFADLPGIFPDLILSGKTRIKGAARFNYSPFALLSANLKLELQEINISYDTVRVQNVKSAEGQKKPFIVAADTGDGQKWDISGSSLSVVSPVPVEISGFAGSIRTSPESIKSAGNVAVVFVPSPVSDKQAVKLEKALPFEAAYSAGYDLDGDWQFILTNRAQKKSSLNPAEFRFDQYKITSKIPDIDLHMEKMNRNIKTAGSARLYDIKLISGPITARVPASVLQGSAEIDLSGKKTSQATLKLKSTGTGINLGSRKIDIPEATLSANFIQDEKSSIRAQGLLRFSDADLSDPELNAAAHGIAASLPLKWPVHGDAKAGIISVAGLRYQNLDLGSVSVKVQQTENGLNFAGNHSNRLIPELALKFTGSAHPFSEQDPKTEIQFELTRSEVKSEIELGKFSAAAQGMHLAGIFSFNGNLLVNPRGFGGGLKAKLRDGRLSWPENKITIDGIQATLSLPDLPNVRSAPQQTLTFKSASLGDIEVNNGSIDFQIESPQSFFIEKSRFKWCDGSVDTQAMRITPQKKDYNLVLFCDRLNLAKVLNQFGAANANGRGTVNGKIPLRYNRGILSFDDGFLFSTPGEGGKILLTDTEILTAGVPPGTPQYVQLELAREALSDYDYTWAKLNITSEGEDLLIGLKLDGKPAKTLPFVYKKEIGGFAKIEADGQGSVFQGINLNVNFRLPLNKILYYKDIINMMK